MEELLKALGYPVSGIIVFLFMAYVWRKIFEKTLDVLMEDRKAELSRETERLKTTMGVESETYKLAAQKRFECLFDLWESSEALFEDTDFSDIDSIKVALEKLSQSVKSLNKYSVLLTPVIVVAVKNYLEDVGKILTNSERNFDKNEVKVDAIAGLSSALASSLAIMNPALSIVAAIGPALVPSIYKALEKKRLESAVEAREHLESVLRYEFGVWIAEDKILSSEEANKQIQPTQKARG